MPHSYGPEPSCALAMAKRGHHHQQKQQLRLTPLRTLLTHGPSASQSWDPFRPVKLIIVALAVHQCDAATLPCPRRNHVPLSANRAHRRIGNSPAHPTHSQLKKGNVVSTHVAAYGLSSVRASYLEAIWTPTPPKHVSERTGHCFLMVG